MDLNGAFRLNLENANYDLRKWRRVVEPQGWDFAALDVGGGLGWTWRAAWCASGIFCRGVGSGATPRCCTRSSGTP